MRIRCINMQADEPLIGRIRPAQRLPTRWMPTFPVGSRSFCMVAASTALASHAQIKSICRNTTAGQRIEKVYSYRSAVVESRKGRFLTKPDVQRG